jgi:hypothetical protein
MALEKELATYKTKLPDMKSQEGKYVLIQDDNVIGFYSSYDDALREGYKQFNLTPFLVKQVASIEPIFYMSRRIVPTVKAV